MGAGAGQAFKRRIQNRNNPLLLFDISGYLDTFAMHIISIQRWYASARRKAT